MDRVTNNINFLEEIEKGRKNKLGLNTVDAKKILDAILNYYKYNIIEEPRNIIGYIFDITICNLNGYNRLGSIENLYKSYGDIYFLDLKNSYLVKNIITDDGDEEVGETISFDKINEFKEVSNISFSLIDLINKCKEKNIEINLFENNNFDETITIEICPYHSYSYKKRLNIYIDSVDKNND